MIKSSSSVNEGGEASPASAVASDASTPQKVAFLGLGGALQISPLHLSKLFADYVPLAAMGIGMASSIIRAGIPVSGYDVWAPSLQKFVEAGGQAAASPEDACKHANVVVLMVVSIDQAMEVLLGKEDGKGEREGVAHRKSFPFPFSSEHILTSVAALPFSPRPRRHSHSLLDLPAFRNAPSLASTRRAGQQAPAGRRSRLWRHAPSGQRRPQHYGEWRRVGPRQGSKGP